MKGLRKIIFPFAPDQSGAVSVFYDLGGMIVICDAGGCAGNICGFDEPRWFTEKSAIFSAGLRDMDAILGRDKQMVQKMADVAEKLQVNFAAVIGTPVPATIATDYQAVKRMAEKKIGVPVMTVDSNGIRWYDSGAEKAYLELMETFAGDTEEFFEEDTEETFAKDTEGERERIPDSVGVLGASPLDTGSLHAPEQIREALEKQGKKTVSVYGAGCTLEDVRLAGRMEENLVIAPSGLKAAKYLKKRFGTPYHCGYPIPETAVLQKAEELTGKKVLIIHQQIRANALRTDLEKEYRADITVASWFMMKPEIKRTGDIHLTEEDQFLDLAENGGYDVIIADETFRKPARKCKGAFIDFPHFAVSGEL